MIKTAIWKGTQEVIEQPDSPEYDLTDGVNTCTRIYGGPFDKLLAAAPDRGGPMTGMDPRYLVERVNIKPKKGARMALMIVTLKFDFGGVSDPSVNAGQWVEEVEWIEVDVPLIRNRRYRSGGDMALVDDDIADIATWERLGRPKLSEMTPDRTTSSGGLSAAATDYIKKMLNGEESFRSYYPVARRTRTVRGAKSERCGLIEDCPVNAKPDGYDWIKSADRITKTGRNGKWVQYQEWSGFDAIDTDLYDHATSLAHARARFLSFVRFKQRMARPVASARKGRKK